MYTQLEVEVVLWDFIFESFGNKILNWTGCRSGTRVDKVLKTVCLCVCVCEKDMLTLTYIFFVIIIQLKIAFWFFFHI